MAKKIKHASKGEIVFLSKGSYEQLHTSILQTLGKNAPFAPVSISTTTVVWENNTKYDFKSISDAPEDIRGQLMLLFEQQSKSWENALKKQRLEYVLTVPDVSYIFYAEDKDNDDNVLNNKYRFLIAGWACRFNKSSDLGSDGLEKDILEAREKHQNVIVEMIDGNGQPIANSPFSYNFNNTVVKDIATDANGRYEQGICLVGSEYKFQYKLTGQVKVLKVQKNIEVYTLKFAPTTTINISVVDQFNNPLPALKTDIKYGSIYLTKFTDGHGKIIVSDLLYDDPSMRIVVNPDGYPAQDFAVNCPECDITVVVNVTPAVKPFLLVRVGGVPASDLTVEFTGAFDGAFSTDSEGKIVLPSLLPGHTFKTSVTREGQVDKGYFTIIADKTEYILDLPEIVAPPISEPPHPDDSDTSDNDGDKISEPDLDLPFDCHVIVKALEDDTPLANYSLKIVSDTIQGIYITDSNGIVPLGKQHPGNILHVMTGESQTDVNDITIEKGKEEYVIYVNKPVVTVKDPDHEIPQECHIKVVSKVTGRPVPDYALIIDSPRMQGNYSTDDNGIVPLQNMTVGVTVTVTPGKHDPVSFDIEQYREEYIIQVDDSNAVLGDILITQYERDKKTPIPNAALTLTNNKGEKITKTTDASGNIVVPRSFFAEEGKVRVHLDIQNRNVRDFNFKFTKTCDHYILYLTEPFNWKKLLWLFIPLLLLLLCLIRCERDITVHTVNTSGEPIASCDVELSYTEHALYKNGEFFYRKKQEHSGVTDQEGEYTFKRMPCSVFSYVFYTLHKGYIAGVAPSGASVDTTFLYHWRKHVDLVIPDTLQNAPTPPFPDPTPVAPIVTEPLQSPCDAGAEGQKNVKAYTVSTPISYNMGTDRGVFEITYETGDACPDQIDIYNHKPGENWKDGTLIFSSGMKTTPTIPVTESVSFSNGSVVTVIVTTGQNDGSLWNYQLSCPQ